MGDVCASESCRQVRELVESVAEGFAVFDVEGMVWIQDLRSDREPLQVAAFVQLNAATRDLILRFVCRR